MTPGRKPTPTALKKLRGNPGKRSLKKQAEPKPPVTRGAAPVNLANDDNLARGFLDKYRPTLQALGLLTDADDAAFEMAARHYSLAIKAYEHVQASGLVTVDDHNEERKHPLIQVFRDNSQAFKSYITEFGMTPSARVRLRIDEADRLSMYERELESEFFGESAAKKGLKVASSSEPEANG